MIVDLVGKPILNAMYGDSGIRERAHPIDDNAGVNQNGNVVQAQGTLSRVARSILGDEVATAVSERCVQFSHVFYLACRVLFVIAVNLAVFYVVALFDESETVSELFANLGWQ